MRTRVHGPSLLHHNTNVLRTLLHLAGEIQGRGEDEVRIRAADFDLCVESLDIDLGSRDGLLAAAEPLSKAMEL